MQAILWIIGITVSLWLFFMLPSFIMLLAVVAFMYFMIKQDISY